MSVPRVGMFDSRGEREQHKEDDADERARAPQRAAAHRRVLLLLLGVRPRPVQNSMSVSVT